jgi:hypothetical protein
VKRINSIRKDDNVFVEFLDYKDKDQLKDFYKLFKKGSGYTVLEYKELDDCIKVITNNEKSTVIIEWNKELGCYVSANKKEIQALLEIVCKMLCYRYKIYSKYMYMFDGILKYEVSDKNGNMNDSNPDYANDEIEIINDMKGLLDLIKDKS